MPRLLCRGCRGVAVVKVAAVGWCWLLPVGGVVLGGCGGEAGGSGVGSGGPRECPPQVTSTWFTKLPPDTKLWSKDISLAYTGPDTTSSSFIDHSEKLDLPQELAAKSFTLFLSPNDEASVTKSSIINRTAVPIRLILPKNTNQPTCNDALAALVKQPVNKKKRTKRVECEQAESNHTNEQLQTVCWDPLANQHNKPDKKKRKILLKFDPNQHKEPDKQKRRIRPKVDCGLVVKNEVTERLQKFITDEMNGSDLKLVIQKVLYLSDLAPRQNSDGEIKVRPVGPNLKIFKEPMLLKIWDMTRTNQQLGFALAVVDRPPLYLMASNGIA
nr:hypothetical protein [Tanacetum cinerariifolium]